MNLGQWIGLLALVLSFYILWQIRQLLLLAFAAVVLATALNRLARHLQKFGIKRLWAVILSISFLIVTLSGFFWLLVPPFADQFQQLTESVPRGINKLNIWVYQLRDLLPSRFVQQLPVLDANNLIQQLQPLVNRFLGGAGAFVGNTLGVVLSFLLMVILSVMMLADPQSYRKAFVRLFPSFYRRRVEEILDECDVALGGWLVGILFNMLVIGVCSWIGLWCLGVPLSLAHGVLAAFLTFIPNIGPGLSVVPPMAIALLEAPWKSVAVLILYVGIQQLETNLLTPYVMAQQVSLLPAVTLLAQVFFATFFGFLGLLLALPLTVVGQVWLQQVLIEDVLDRWGTPAKKTNKPTGGVGEGGVGGFGASDSPPQATRSEAVPPQNVAAPGDVPYPPEPTDSPVATENPPGEQPAGDRDTAVVDDATPLT